MSIKRLLWQRSGGYWLFWISFVYFWVGMYYVFVDKFCPDGLIQVIWLVFISAPLWFKPLAKWLNMRTIWEL